MSILKFLIIVVSMFSGSAFANSNVFINYDKITASSCEAGLEGIIDDYMDSQSLVKTSVNRSSNPLTYTIELLVKEFYDKGYSIVNNVESADFIADISAHMRFCPGHGSFESSFSMVGIFEDTNTGHIKSYKGSSEKVMLPILGMFGISYKEAVKDLLKSI